MYFLNHSFSFFEVLLLIGIVQGFLIAFLIFFKKAAQTSKLLLAFMLLVFNLLCIKILLHTTGLWQTAVFRYFPLAIELAIQPLIWLYILSLTKPGFRLTKKHLLHFVPCAISFAYSLFIYIVAAKEHTQGAKDAVANLYYFNEIKQTEDYLVIFSSVIYWVLGLRRVLQYRGWLNDNLSDTNYPAYGWLKNVALLMGLLIILLTAATLLDYFFHAGARYFLHWQIFFVYLAGLIYYLGFRGYLLPGDLPSARAPDEQVVLAAAGSVDKLTGEKETEVRHAVLAALEQDKLYLDQELNLQKLALHVNAGSQAVSSVINRHFGKTFRTLINEYRVQEVKRRLGEPVPGQLSLLGIAYECGFNSEASFYRIFKSTTGFSPKEYLNYLKKDSQNGF